MEIKSLVKSFWKEEYKRINLEKKISDNIYFYADIYFLSDKFVEFQKNLFNEFFGEIIDKLSSVNIQIDDFRNFFEAKLQDFNVKLNVFSEKLKDNDKISIKWSLQIIFDGVYFNTMIWEVSTIIYRDSELIYSVENETEQWKIDVFSELVEWEVENGDKILVVGLKVFDFLEKDDLKEIIEISRIEEKPLLDTFVEIITSRVAVEELIFVRFLDIKIDLPVNFILEKKNQNKLIKVNDLKEFVKNFIIKNKYPIWISIVLILVLYLIYILLSNFVWNTTNSKVIIHTWTWTQAISCDSADISKQIETFQKIPVDSPKKVEVYQDLLKQIKFCKEEGFSVVDMNKLEKTLNTVYFQSFNIFFVNNRSDKLVVSIPKDILNKLGNLIWLIYNKKFFVPWDKAILFGLVNKEILGKLIEYNIPDNISWCNLNLLWNWVYCWSKEGNLYDITKNWLKSVFINGGLPKNIVAITKYFTNKLYILTHQADLNKKGVYIIRLDNIPGSQDRFKSITPYIFDKEFFDKYKDNFSSGFSDLVIDSANWTFLAWSKKDKSLYQFWRKSSTSNYVVWRKVPMSWWPENLQPFSSDVKIFVFWQANKYWNRIYFYDKKSKTLRVYRSIWRKSNDRYAKNYILKYEFMLSFNDLDVVDVWVKLVKTPIVFILTKDGNIYKIDLGMYADILWK